MKRNICKNMCSRKNKRQESGNDAFLPEMMTAIPPGANLYIMKDKFVVTESSQKNKISKLNDKYKITDKVAQIKKGGVT